jgi:hypothetical protein
MPTAERRKQPRPVSTEDDLARFHASVAGGNHFPTTTRRPRTRANTGSDLAHARETTREKRRTERPRGAQSAETKGVALARRICEVPPRLAYRADVKKPETSSGFWNWWPVAESNHGHADFQSAALPTELTGRRAAHYSHIVRVRQNYMRKYFILPETSAEMALPVCNRLRLVRWSISGEYDTRDGTWLTIT